MIKMEKPTNDTERAIWVQAYYAGLSGAIGQTAIGDDNSMKWLSKALVEHANLALEKYREHCS